MPIIKIEQNTMAMWPALNQEYILLGELRSRLARQESMPSIIRFGMDFRGSFKYEALCLALNEIVGRHPGLRTVFFDNPEVSTLEREQRATAFSTKWMCERGLYTQLLLKRAHVPIQRVDLSGIPQAEQGGAIHVWLRNEDRRPFDRQRAPLLRASVVTLGPAEHLVILFIDHIVSDGWSAMILRRELHRLYLEYHHFSKTKTPIEPPRTSFPEFAAWQNRALTADYFDTDLRYWRDQWARFGSSRIAVEDLTPQVRPAAKPVVEFASDHRYFSEEESDLIRAFARQSQVTMFVVFLSALTAVLVGRTGKRQLAIWSHLSNRTRSETADVVGYFANSHILGVDVSANPTGHELLIQMRQIVSDALTHQELPLWHMWRVLNCAPRFPRPIMLLDYLLIPKLPKTATTDLEIRDVSLPDSVVPRLALLGIYIRDDGKCMVMKVGYAMNLFASDAMRVLLTDLTTVLRALIRNPLCSVSDLAGLSTWHSSRQVDEDAINHFLLLDSALIPSVPCSR